MYLNRASDRTHWDGWASKAMFMRPDGKYTSRNFTIEAGDSLCAVVLVGYFIPLHPFYSPRGDA